MSAPALFSDRTEFRKNRGRPLTVHLTTPVSSPKRLRFCRSAATRAGQLTRIDGLPAYVFAQVFPNEVVRPPVLSPLDPRPTKRRRSVRSSSRKAGLPRPSLARIDGEALIPSVFRPDGKGSKVGDENGACGDAASSVGLSVLLVTESPVSQNTVRNKARGPKKPSAPLFFWRKKGDRE